MSQYYCAEVSLSWINIIHKSEDVSLHDITYNKYVFILNNVTSV